ncbi:MAG: hypothetical protein ACXW1U_16835, partial [Methylobacter sp.]
MSAILQSIEEATAPIEQALILGLPGFSYSDLYEPNRLKDLLAIFDQELEGEDSTLYAEYLACRADLDEAMPEAERAEILLKVAPYVSRFVARLFNIEANYDAKRTATIHDFQTVFTYKGTVVKRAAERFTMEELATWDIPFLTAQIEALKQVG